MILIEKSVGYSYGSYERWTVDEYGKKQGKWERFDKKGKLQVVKYYRNDKLHGESEYMMGKIFRRLNDYHIHGKLVHKEIWEKFLKKSKLRKIRKIIKS